MSDREAFEKFYRKSVDVDANFNRNDNLQYRSAYTQYAWVVWQAALQSGEPVAYWNKDFTYASFIKLADHIEGEPPSGWVPLYTTPQPVVPEVVFDILKAAQGSCRLGVNDIADKQIEIAIKTLLSAGKENKNE